MPEPPLDKPALEGLHLVVRTPHEITLDEHVLSARVPTESGHVGLRPRQEPLILAVEAGLSLAWTNRGALFVASAGGLLEADRRSVVLYTPFAAVSGSDSDVLEALDRALTTPDSELSARRRLDELEQRIVAELHHRPAVRRTRSTVG